MTLVYLSHGPAETRRLGERLARLFQPSDVVLLQGELGAGKTCLAQGIGRGLRVAEAVKSSSFVLVNEYSGRLHVYHADLFRLEDPAEVFDLYLEENAHDGLLLVEWPDRAPREMPPEHLLVRFEIVDDHDRRIELVASGARYEALLAGLAADTTLKLEVARAADFDAEGLLVSFDTAADIAGVALTEGNSVVAEATWGARMAHSRGLLPALVWLLELSSRSKADLRAVAIDLGPGSYAGLRVGLSTAKALAYGLGLPLVGVDRLAADALPIALATGGPVAAFQAAGRAELAWGVFRQTDAGLETLLAPTLGPIQGSDGFLHAVPYGAVVCGEIDKLDADTKAVLTAVNSARLAEAPPNRVVAVASLARQRLRRGEVDNADALVPLYLRAPAIGPQTPR